MSDAEDFLDGGARQTDHAEAQRETHVGRAVLRHLAGVSPFVLRYEARMLRRCDFDAQADLYLAIANALEKKL